MVPASARYEKFTPPDLLSNDPDLLREYAEALLPVTEVGARTVTTHGERGLLFMSARLVLLVSSN